ncbi:MAG TPA: ComEC/Rec2 family competence protein [Pyrinomonadaceae bacterium]
MAQNRRGCGCLLVVLALALVTVAGVYFKFYRTKGPELPPASGGELQVHVLDVGQGDAILIIAPGGKAALIDAGDEGHARVVRDALSRYQVQQLEYFVATHPHPDHIGGAPVVLNSVKVLNVLDSGVPPPDFDAGTSAPAQNPKGKNKNQSAKSQPKPRARGVQLPTVKAYTALQDAIKQSGAQLAQVAPGQHYDLGGGVVLTALAPVPPPFTKDQVRSGGNEPNANSIVLRLDYGDFSLLLPGDAEAQTEQRLLNGSANLTARLLKVAHHGSKYATSTEFLNRIKPEAAIISLSEYNRYGHPAQVVLDRLKTAGVKLYRTDLHGEISITSKGEGYEIKTEKEAKGDLYAGREGQKDDSARSGFIAYGDFGPPPKQAKPTVGNK